MDYLMHSFELPIELQINKKKTDKHLIEDLGLNNDDSLYNTVLDLSNNIGCRTAGKWCKYYTTDVSFLKDTQKFLTRPFPKVTLDTTNVLSIWNDIEVFDSLNDDGAAFTSQYQYLEWERLYILNTNSTFLQWMSIYNMSSPVFSLLLPIMLLFIPFIILRVRNMDVSFENYLTVLKSTFAKHQIGQLFSLDASASWEKRGYVAVSTGFYCLQIYQNIRACIQFWKNITFIQNQINTVRIYLKNCIDYMERHDRCCEDFSTYKLFLDNNKLHQTKLKQLYKELESVSTNKITFKDVAKIGHMMKCFYLLYQDPGYKKSLDYSFDFCGYLENLKGLKENINSEFLGKCRFSKKQTKFKKAFYPVVADPVKNSYNLDKHILVTGPNAAGKTTMLKTTIFNILLSQQIGHGCYASASIMPYDHIHCYINIPDTSDRDSLFQAEARRCKNILTSILENGKDSRHFCVFDELYSGTNPYEAIGSAAAFLKHLATNNNVSFIITTHFIGLCQRLEKEKRIKNCHMKTSGSDDNFKYTYRLSNGISSVKGGVRVLRDLEYPAKIVVDTKKIIQEISL